jgi:hypothetical protein
MESMSRRGLLKTAGGAAAGIAGAAVIGKTAAVGQPKVKQPDDVAGQMAIAKLNHLHARVKSGAAQASDYVAVATAFSIASEQWEGNGTNAIHHKELQQAVAGNPAAGLSPEQVHQLYLKVAATGSPATEAEVRAKMFATDHQRRKLAEMLNDPHALVNLQRECIKQFTDMAKRIERGAIVNHATMRQVNVSEWDVCAAVGVIGLYDAVIGFACPVCAPLAAIFGVILAIAGLFCL